MPNSTQHKQKAEHNRQFAAIAAAAPGYQDWVAVALFYSAVHLAERLRTVRPKLQDQHSKDHGGRLSFLLAHHPAIYAEFKALYDASLVARYRTAQQFANAYPGTVVQDKLLGEYYVKIAAYVTAQFAPPPAP